MKLRVNYGAAYLCGRVLQVRGGRAGSGEGGRGQAREGRTGKAWGNAGEIEGQVRDRLGN